MVEWKNLSASLDLTAFIEEVYISGAWWAKRLRYVPPDGRIETLVDLVDLFGELVTSDYITDLEMDFRDRLYFVVRKTNSESE